MADAAAHCALIGWHLSCVLVSMGPQYGSENIVPAPVSSGAGVVGSVVSSGPALDQDTCDITSPQLFISEAEDYSNTSGAGLI